DAADPNSPTSAEGVYGIYVDPSPDTPEYHQFQNLYSSLFPSVDVTDTVLLRSTANQYDACMLIALALQKAGGAADRVKLRDALYDVSHGAKPGAAAFGPAKLPDAIAAIKRGEDIDYVGASGQVDFDDNGLVQEDF